MAILELPVTLIVKASNQQVADQTVHCSLSWTIKKLKGHLSEVYPSRPSTEEQKIIFYGRLLNDSVTLKDVFTRYEAGETIHTVHLVCKTLHDKRPTQLNMAEQNNENRVNENVNQRLSPNPTNQEEDLTNEGVRQRFSNSFVNRTGFQPWMNPPTNTYDPNIYVQQMAWMQQAYANYYMSQYMEMVQRQNNIGYRDIQLDGVQRNPNEAFINPDPQPAPVADNDDEDGRGNRDWLDYFYIMSRMVVLFSIVYFYSSPVRFIIVSTLGILLYMYQVGFFRLHQIQGLENNNDPAQAQHPGNNNLINNDEAAGAGARVDAQPQEGEAGAPAETVVTEAPRRPSPLALAWTFLTGFLSSIIPETHNAV